VVSSEFSTNILYAFLFSPNRATCPYHLMLLNLIVLIKVTKLFIMQFSPTSHHFFPHYSLSFNIKIKNQTIL
jgi:hypothetical protein